MPGDVLTRQFAAAPRLFMSSPLYARLGTMVAADDRLLAIAAQARAGQLPPNLLMAAVHYLMLRDRMRGDPAHDLANWYPSAGGCANPATADPGPAFTDFCLTRRAELIGLMRRRLVQINVVKRSSALRLGLAVVASMTDGPVALIEVGCSAGVHLRL